MTFDGDTDI